MSVRNLRFPPKGGQSKPSKPSKPQPAPEQRAPSTVQGEFGFEGSQLEPFGVILPTSTGGGGVPQAPPAESGGVLRKLLSAGLIGLGGALGYNALFGASDEQVNRRSFQEQQIMDLLMGVPEQNAMTGMARGDLGLAYQLARMESPRNDFRMKNISSSPDLRGLLGRSDLNRIRQARMVADMSLGQALAMEGIY